LKGITVMYSMTGFGKAEKTTRFGDFNVEISSVNNRFLEVSVRQPRQFSALEYRIKELVGTAANRGKVYVFIGFTESESLPGKYAINVKAAEAYAQQLRAVQKKMKLGGELTVGDLLTLPELAQTGDVSLDVEEVWTELAPIIQTALKGLTTMRKKEGAAMSRDMRQRLKEIEKLNRITIKLSPKTVERYREKLKTRVADLLNGSELDPGRLEQEVALLAERADVSEECTRLNSHIAQYRADLDISEPVGKRLNFILQEMNRESNTIASKCTDADITSAVISLKEEIEKLREQVQNIE